jgi:hypothetical protein
MVHTASRAVVEPQQCPGTYLKNSYIKHRQITAYLIFHLSEAQVSAPLNTCVS